MTLDRTFLDFPCVAAAVREHIATHGYPVHVSHSYTVRAGESDMHRHTFMYATGVVLRVVSKGDDVLTAVLYADMAAVITADKLAISRRN